MSSRREIVASDGITIAGSYNLVISLVDPTDTNGDNELRDFIELECFDHLVFDESAGFKLPMISLGFKAFDYKILSRINQGNILKIVVRSSFVNSEGNLEYENAISGDFSILKPRIITEGNLKKVKIIGIYDRLDFLNKRNSRTFKDMTSTDAMYWVARQHFTPDFGTEDLPMDQQTWIQSNQTDCSFLKHLFSRANYGYRKDASGQGTISWSSFPITGITSSGVFRHRDLRSWVENTNPTYSLKFSEPDATENNLGEKTNTEDIPYLVHNGDILDGSNAGILNIWRSNGSIVPVIDMDSGGIPNFYEESVKLGLLSGMPNGNRRNGSSPSVLAVEYNNSNTYDGYCQSKSRNITGAASYSTQVVAMTYRWKMHPLSVLDYVLLEDPDARWNDRQGTDSSERTEGLKNVVTSGKYLVSRITRKFSKDIKTRIELCRDAPAEQMGDLS